MKISIVTVSYNQAVFVERAMRSVLEQDYRDVEYIIVDPGSTDGSRAIIERYRNRLAHVVFEPDSGPADGLNHGFVHATGHVLGFLNADDALLPGALSRVAAAFARYPEAAVVYGHGHFVDADDRRLRRFRSSSFGLRRFAFGGAVIMQQAAFFRRAAFERVGGFNAKNRTCWDAELWVDLALGGARFHCIDHDLALFRIHPGSITGSGRLNTLYRGDQLRLFEKIMGRKPRRLDTLGRVAARLAKWTGDPRSAGLAVAARLRGRAHAP